MNNESEVDKLRKVVEMQTAALKRWHGTDDGSCPWCGENYDQHYLDCQWNLAIKAGEEVLGEGKHEKTDNSAL